MTEDVTYEHRNKVGCYSAAFGIRRFSPVAYLLGTYFFLNIVIQEKRTSARQKIAVRIRKGEEDVIDDG